ncbi:MAG TPA: ABC transporter permease [Terriglobales bacterium]|nr:ABC transporter permease [Terriglobales bacterium]
MSPSRIAARLRSTLRAITRRSQLENEMDSELRFHIQNYTADLVRSGVPVEEAARRARVELGGIAQQKEEMRASVGLRLWDELCGDLAYTVRLLRKSPGFTAVALLSLALGIGANTTIFTFANHFLIERLHVPHPEQLRLFTVTAKRNSILHHMWGNTRRVGQGAFSTTSFTYPIYEQLRGQQKLLKVFAFKDVDITATIDGEAVVLGGEMVSGNYYQEMQINPQLGRPIQPQDDAAPGSGPVAVISDGFWARRFGRSPGVIGKTIELNLTPITIVGVNPAGFTGALQAQRSPDVFFPLSMQPLLEPRGKKGSLLGDPDNWWVLMMGRLQPGMSPEKTLAAMRVAFDQAVHATIAVKANETVPVLTLDDGSRGLQIEGEDLRSPILVLMTLVGVVLLLACVNLANLLLARSSARLREMSVRFALGAGRARILRQVLTECVALSLAGGGLGLCLAYWARKAIPAVMSNGWDPATVPPPLDWRVFAYTAALAVITGLIFGLAPALKASRVEINSGLKEGAQPVTARRRGYASKALVSFQVALSLLLVVAAGLFVRTVMNLSTAELGFEAKNLVLFGIAPPPSRYPAGQDVALVRRLEQRLAAVPGAQSVTVSAIPLVANSMWNDDFVPEGETQRPGEQGYADVNAVGAQFFTTMGIPIIAGRGFNDGDSETSPKVAVINQALARRFFPNVNPIGRSFNKEHAEPLRDIRIVGICGDTKYQDLREDAPPMFFVPYRQQLTVPFGVTFEVRTSLKPAALVPSLRAALQSVDKDLPLVDARTQEQQIAATMMQERIFGELTACFGVLALTLACIGIYGILAYSVARRTNEIGIRIALGARARQVLGMVLGEASWMALVGVAAGAAGALALSRFVGSLLYGIRAADPATFLAAAVLLFAVAVLAGWLPARRASRIQPLQALRHD